MKNTDSMEKAALVSIIVPCYNVEQYLRECVDSILRQTYSNLEVILVDDGSKDDTPNICDSYARDDRRVAVIHQKNSGVSAARNIGIKKSSGEYVMFVDSDDYVDTKMVEGMLGILLADDLDVITCSPNRTYINGKVAPQPRDETDVLLGDEIMLRFIHDIARISDGVVWGRLFRRRVASSVKFDESMRRGEDATWLFEVFRKCTRAKYVADCWYYYRENPTSIVSVKRLSDIAEMQKFNQLILDYAQGGQVQNVKNSQLHSLISLLDQYAICIIAGSCKDTRLEIRREINATYKNYRQRFGRTSRMVSLKRVAINLPKFATTLAYESYRMLKRM